MRGQSDVLAVVVLVVATLALGLALFAYSVSQQSWLAGEKARVSYLNLISSSIDVVLVYSSSNNGTACVMLEVINIGVEEHYITVAVVSGVISRERIEVRAEATVRLAELRSSNGLIPIPQCPSSFQPLELIDISSLVLPEGYTLGEAGAPKVLAPAMSTVLRPGASKTLYVEAPQGSLSVLVIAYINKVPHLAFTRVYATG